MRYCGSKPSAAPCCVGSPTLSSRPRLCRALPRWLALVIPIISTQQCMFYNYIYCYQYDYYSACI